MNSREQRGVVCRHAAAQGLLEGHQTLAHDTQWGAPQPISAQQQGNCKRPQMFVTPRPPAYVGQTWGHRWDRSSRRTARSAMQQHQRLPAPARHRACASSAAPHRCNLRRGWGEAATTQFFGAGRRYGGAAAAAAGATTAAGASHRCRRRQ